MNIRSERLTIDKPAEKVFDFLNDFNNYEKLMPEQVVKWESDARAGRFTIRDLTEIGMRIQDAAPYHKILLSSDGKVPFDFTMSIEIGQEGENQASVQIIFDGNVSPMIAMMARRPLTNLVNHMVEKVREQAL